MGRAPCCDKANVKRGPWSPEEDSKLKDYIVKHGNGGNWIALPQKAGLKRCGKSCRLRWLNYLRPNIKHGEFSDAEDRLICSMFATIGSRWSIIAAQLPGRTDNDIKNYWNTKLRKKLMGSTTSSSSSSPFMVPSNHHPHHPTGSSKLSSNPFSGTPFSAIQNMNHEQLLNPSFITSTTIPDQSNSNHLLLNYNYNPHGLGPNNNHQPLEALVSHSINGLMFGGGSHHDQASSSSDGSYSQISHGNYKICCDDGGVQMNQEESNQVGFITNGYGNGSEINHQSNKFMLDFGSSKAIDGGDHNYMIGATATWNNDDTDHQKLNGYFGHNNNNVIATTTTSSNTPLVYDSLEEVKQLIRVTNNPLLLLNAENKTKEGEEEKEEERMRRHMYYY